MEISEFLLTLSLSGLRHIYYYFPTFPVENSVIFYIFLSYGTVQNLGHCLSGLFPLIYHHFLLCICPVVFFFPLISIS